VATLLVRAMDEILGTHTLETSVPLTLILLALVFGALVAAGIPVLLAVSSALTATWLLAIPGHWLPLGSLYSEVVLLIGMAVGVDYSLFYLRREREERTNGASMAEAIAAARTSGRVILASVRADCDARASRAVPHRIRAIHRDRDRGDRRSGDRGGRLAHSAARACGCR
jgi:hypothetical protein